MKTTVLFRMMVLVAMVVAGIANTELKAQDNNFITNEEKVDDLEDLKSDFKQAVDSINVNESEE